MYSDMQGGRPYNGRMGRPYNGRVEALNGVVYWNKQVKRQVSWTPLKQYDGAPLQWDSITMVGQGRVGRPYLDRSGLPYNGKVGRPYNDRVGAITMVMWGALTMVGWYALNSDVYWNKVPSKSFSRFQSYEFQLTICHKVILQSIRLLLDFLLFIFLR